MIQPPTLRRIDVETDENGAEKLMRQALERLGTAKQDKPKGSRPTTYQATSGAGRHRFKKAGDVPVVQLTLGTSGRGGESHAHTPAGNGGAPRQKVAPQDQGREGGIRQIQDLTDHLRVAQTRLGHAELAAAEATRMAKVGEEEVFGLRQALDVTEAALTHVRMELAASEHAREERRRQMTKGSGSAAGRHQAVVPRRKVGRPLGSTNRVRDQMTDSSSEPVKWWTGD